MHPHMPRVLCEAGALPGLLAQLDLSRPFPYTRCLGAPQQGRTQGPACMGKWLELPSLCLELVEPALNPSRG